MENISGDIASGLLNAPSIVVTMATFFLLPVCSHVQSLAGNELPRQVVDISKKRREELNTPQRYNEDGFSQRMDLSEELSRSGIIKAGKIAEEVVQQVKEYADSSKPTQQHSRQSWLPWEKTICGNAVEYFDAHVKPTIKQIKDKPCSFFQLIRYHENPEQSLVEWPSLTEGRYTTIMTFKEGQGQPVVFKGSQAASERNSLNAYTMVAIPQDEGDITVFDSRIARMDPAVAAGKGATVILMLH